MKVEDVVNFKHPKVKQKKWMGTPPEKCDFCHREIHNVFIDGKTIHGPWANMCLMCHMVNGTGIGTGCGQKYMKQDNGDWLKVEG